MLTMFGTSSEGGLDVLIHRKPLPWWQRFLRAPLKTLTKTLYALRSVVILPHKQPIRIVCISDTHNQQPLLPQGDILVHAGDLSQSGSVAEIQTQIDWINSQQHQHKIVIAGNHDIAFASEAEREKINLKNIQYLQDNSTKVQIRDRSLNLFGSPWTRKHGNWCFQYGTAESRFWSGKVPVQTDVLITHMPPQFHLDLDGSGDRSLLDEVQRTRPLLHVFGHLHAGRGQDLLTSDAFERAYVRSCGQEHGKSVKWLYTYCCSRWVFEPMSHTLDSLMLHVWAGLGTSLFGRLWS